MARTHRSRGVRSDPNAHCIVTGKADVPGVCVIVRGAGLAAARMAESACSDSCGRAVDVHVLQHVDHNVCACRF